MTIRFGGYKKTRLTSLVGRRRERVGWRRGLSSNFLVQKVSVCEYGREMKFLKSLKVRVDLILGWEMYQLFWNILDIERSQYWSLRSCDTRSLSPEKRQEVVVVQEGIVSRECVQHGNRVVEARVYKCTDQWNRKSRVVWVLETLQRGLLR